MRPVVASREELATLIAKLSRLDDVLDAEAEVEEETLDRRRPLATADQEAPVIKLVHALIAEAVDWAPATSTSPPRATCSVYYRVDGVLAPASVVPKADEPRRRLAYQDHGEPRHLRASRPAGRPAALTVPGRPSTSAS